MTMIFTTASATVLWLLSQLPPGTPDWVATLIFDHHWEDWELPHAIGYKVPDDFDIERAGAAIRRILSDSPYQPIP